MKNSRNQREARANTVQRRASGPAPGKSSRSSRRYGRLPVVQAKREDDAQTEAEGLEVAEAAEVTDGDAGATAGPGASADAAPDIAPAPNAAPPAPQPPTAGPLTVAEARARWQTKETLRGQIEAQITQEDADRGGVQKTRTTRSQSAAELTLAEQESARARTAIDAGQSYEAPLIAFEQAVDALHRAYLASSMQSTDGNAVPFEVTANFDVLGSATAHAKMLQWQNASREDYNSTVKFAVPPPATTGGQLICRVGNPMEVGHDEVAGGDAIAAGFIRVGPTGHTVTAFENTSGGFRPGSLRNATARSAIEAAQPIAYTIVEGARQDNPTGGYDTSTMT